jgi:hypothetical protein
VLSHKQRRYTSQNPNTANAKDEIQHQNVQDCEKWHHARCVAGTAAELDTIALELATDGLAEEQLGVK